MYEHRQGGRSTNTHPAHFGAQFNGFELVDTREDLKRPMNEADVNAKLWILVAWGDLTDAHADRADTLALGGNDLAAIIAMLGDWLL